MSTFHTELQGTLGGGNRSEYNLKYYATIVYNTVLLK